MRLIIQRKRLSNINKETLCKIYWLAQLHKSSRSEVFCKKGILRKFAKFVGKHLCESFFLNKVAGLYLKRLWHRCFSVNFVKFLSKITFSYRTPPVTASPVPGSLKFILRSNSFDLVSGEKPFAFFRKT